MPRVFAGFQPIMPPFWRTFHRAIADFNGAPRIADNTHSIYLRV
jgi:hypothetical protein